MHLAAKSSTSIKTHNFQLAGMVRRPSQSFNGFDAPSTSSTSNVPSGSKTTAQKFLELPNQRVSAFHGIPIKGGVT